eukprot:jgi/Ulvmu1/1604/UM111_0033.1
MDQASGSARKSRSFRASRMLSRKGTEEDTRSISKSRDFRLGEDGDRLIENLTSDATASDSPTSPNAILGVLLVRREVAEDLLKKFWALEHPMEAARLSQRGKRHAQHKAINGKKFCETGYPENCRSIFGLPMLPDDSRIYMYWSALIILIDATYTSLWVPVSAAFESAHFVTSPTGSLDFSMGLLFLADILMRFHMPIRLTGSFLGTTLHRGNIVARFYVFNGSFIVDFLAAVPLVVLPVVQGAERVVIFVLVLRVLRLLRVQRIISMLSNVQVMSVNGASGWRMVIGQALSTLYSIIVMVNLSACLWYFVGRQSLSSDGDGWLNQEYKFNGLVDQERCDEFLADLEADGKPEVAERLDCASLFFAEGGDVKLWSISVYYVVVTLTTVGYGDITPASMAEVWISMLIMIFGLALFASILGNIADIVATGSRAARQAAAVRAKLTDVQQWMEDRTLSVATRREVLRYYAEDWKLVHDEQADILEELPADVAGNAIWDLVAVDVQMLPLFSTLRQHSDGNVTQHAMRALAAKMRPMSTSRGTMVCGQGDNADALYFLQRGEVEVLHLTQRVATLIAPAVFGEASLLRNSLDATKKRLSGYRTTLTSMIWKLDIEDVESMAPLVPDLQERLILGVKRTVYEKLRLLSRTQLELILLFLKQMQGSAMNFHRIEKMMPRMFDAVDMAVVQILTYYDRMQFQTVHAAMSTVRSSNATSPRQAAAAEIGFRPHCVPADKSTAPSDGLPMPPSHGGSHPPSQPPSHPGSPHSRLGPEAANAAWEALSGTLDGPAAAVVPSDVSGPAAISAEEETAAAELNNADEAEVMAEFDAKAAVVEADKEKAEAQRLAELAAKGGKKGSTVDAASVAPDHVEIDVPASEDSHKEGEEKPDDLPTLHKGFGSSLGELSFAGEVTKGDRPSSEDPAGAVKHHVDGRHHVNFKTFSFPHAMPHLHKVAEEANGRLMDEMTRKPPASAGVTSASSVVQALDGMSGTEMIYSVLAEMDRDAEGE